MNKYKKDKLVEYIEKSQIRIYSKKIKIRLNEELARKYDEGKYDNYFRYIKECITLIETINIKYPANANPFYYIYIVPDENFAELLDYPFNNQKSGGKPVVCQDLDGFSYAYGTSQNLCENFSEDKKSISLFENIIHEFAHLIHSQFFKNSRILGEGFAEMLPLYGLELENKYEDHKECIINLNESNIYTVEEMLNLEEKNLFDDKSLLSNKTCSFRTSYISSYLFVRGCIETIEKKFNLSKNDSINYFLEIVYKSQFISAWLFFDIADHLGLDKEEILAGKSLQMRTIESIRTS